MKKKIKLTRSDKIFNFFNYIVLTVIGLLTLFPFLDVLLTSITPTEEIVMGARNIITIPKAPTLDHYIFVIEGNNAIFRAMGVTVFRTIVGTGVNLLVTILTAYPLSKKYLPYRNGIMKYFFFTMIFSGGMIPTFLVVRSFGLIDTLWAFILPGALNVYNMIIMRTYFSGISIELEEAAKIDGCPDLKVLYRIILPVSKPVLASVGLFYAVWHWNSFFDAVMYINDRNLWPLQTLLREILLSTSLSELLGGGGMLAESMPPTTAVINATIMISCIPIIIVYPFLQKHFAKGVMIGSVKG